METVYVVYGIYLHSGSETYGVFNGREKAEQVQFWLNYYRKGVYLVAEEPLM